jgi:uridine kinase
VFKEESSLTRPDLIDRLVEMCQSLRRPHPVRVAIDGPDAAGKTTLADELARALRERGRSVIRASIDDWHLPREQRHRRGEASPKGYYEDSFDLPALKRALLGPLGPGGSLEYRSASFDFCKDVRLLYAGQLRRRAPC